MKRVLIVAIEENEDGTANVEMASYDESVAINAGDLITIAANCINLLAQGSGKHYSSVCDDVNQLLRINHKNSRKDYDH